MDVFLAFLWAIILFVVICGAIKLVERFIDKHIDTDVAMIVSGILTAFVLCSVHSVASYASHPVWHPPHVSSTVYHGN